MELTSFLEELAGNRDLLSYNEDEIKQTVVLPLFQFLGWNIFSRNEVTPEYSLQSKRVDYALRFDDKAMVFVEVKRPSVSLDDCEEQLLTYSFRAGVPLSVLTNGVNWWFYLSLREGSWEKRKYFSINVYDQKPEESAERLSDFIGKDNVLSGQAEKNAEQVLKGKSRARNVAITLPKAWKALVSEPDELLIELLKDKVEDLSGYTPSPYELMDFFSQIPEFLQNHNTQEEIQTTRKVVSANVRKIPTRTNDAAGKIGQDEMENDILDVLQQLGARATKGRVEDVIFDKYIDEFIKEWYQECVAKGIPRWKHNIAWAKEKLKHKGLIKPPSESGRGIWELTKVGKERKTR